MYKEPTAMKEIHKIQEQLYEERRGLSDKKVIEKTRQEAEKVMKQYGLKLRKGRSGKLNNK